MHNEREERFPFIRAEIEHAANGQHRGLFTSSAIRKKENSSFRAQLTRILEVGYPRIVVVAEHLKKFILPSPNTVADQK